MKKRPSVLRGTTTKVKTGCGSLYCTINKDEEGNPFEVKLSLGKAGSCINTMLYREAILWSIVCQLGATREDLVKLVKRHWCGISCENAEKLEDGRFSSCGEMIGRTILDAIEESKGK